MSLILAAWDQSLGIAVCEGRAVAKVNGVKVPVYEDHSKLSRLPDGSILGLTGGLRDGYETTSLRDVIVTEPLRRDIHREAETHTFREMYTSVIPRILAEYGARYPELGFGVSLLGNDGGKIRGAAWSGTGHFSAPKDIEGVNAHILGLSEAVNHEAATAVREYFAGRNCVDLSETRAALERIIKDLATRHVELNDHIQVELIAPECGSVDGFCLNSLEPKESGSDVTAGHILTAVSTSTHPNMALSHSSYGAISDLGFTTVSSGTSDVFNFYGGIALTINSTGVNIAIAVDGVVMPGSSRYYTKEGTCPYFASITGLSAGSHTITVVANADGAADYQDPRSTYMVCQRIY